MTPMRPAVPLEMPSPTASQRLQPLVGKPAGSLLLHEVYRSVQGESTFAGLPCVFVRTTTCDLRCVWCDTPHAFTEGTVWSIDDVLDKVRSFETDRKSTRLNSSHRCISYAVFCLKKKIGLLNTTAPMNWPNASKGPRTNVAE